MATCMVLRCGNESAATRVVHSGDPDRLPIEFRVCREHDSLIAAGLPFRYNDEDHAVYVGKDIDAAGLRMLVDYLGWQDDAGMPSDMHRHVFRDDAGDEFSFILPDWLAGTLRRRWAEQGIGDDDVQGA